MEYAFYEVGGVRRRGYVSWAVVKLFELPISLTRFDFKLIHSRRALSYNHIINAVNHYAKFYD